MKYILFLLLLIAGHTSVSQQIPDSVKIVELIKADYKTMADWDIEKHLSYITSDYILIEKGEYLTRDKETAWYHSMKDRKMERSDEFHF